MVCEDQLSSLSSPSPSASASASASPSPILTPFFLLTLSPRLRLASPPQLLSLSTSTEPGCFSLMVEADMKV